MTYIVNDAIIRFYSSNDYSMKDIGDYFGKHYKWIRKLISQNTRVDPLFGC